LPLIQTLSDQLTLIKVPGFPASYKSSKGFRHRAIVGLGGNVGDVIRRFQHLAQLIKREPRISLLHTSPVLQNPPFGYLDQDDFLNSVIEIETNLNPRQLLTYLLRTEKCFGRKRSFANAPRTLDLDLIFFDKVKMQTPSLTLPHPHWNKRESVLIPLRHLGVL